MEVFPPHQPNKVVLKCDAMPIIIIVFCLIALPNQNKVDPRRTEKASTIQCLYKKYRTHARAFSRTLAHLNSKIEIRQRKRIRR